MFLDITTPLRNSVGREVLRAAFTQMEARSALVLESVIQDPRLGRVGDRAWQRPASH